MSTDKDQREQAARDASPEIQKANQPAAVLAYAQLIAIGCARLHYSENETPFSVYGDLSGVLEQIDNMLTGLIRRPAYGDKEPTESGWYWATNDQFEAVVRVDKAPRGMFCAWHTRVDKAGFCELAHFPKSRWSDRIATVKN